eukprot:412211-Pyramimonas_sp.AAC.1
MSEQLNSGGAFRTSRSACTSQGAQCLAFVLRIWTCSTWNSQNNSFQNSSCAVCLQTLHQIRLPSNEDDYEWELMDRHLTSEGDASLVTVTAKGAKSSASDSPMPVRGGGDEDEVESKP